MVRGCSQSDVIECEELEINAFHNEKQATLILLDHCRAMRRQECLSRFAMAFILISGLGVFFFLRTTLQDGDMPITKENGITQSLQQGGKPRAHLTVTECNQTPKTDTLAWEIVCGLADTYGFGYDPVKKALIVQQAGFYNVYLQITFRTPENSVCRSSLSNYLLNAVVHATDSYGTSDELMTISESLPCSELSRRSVFASGMYDLEKNTELAVNVSDINLVDRCSETITYFGAFLYEESP